MMRRISLSGRVASALTAMLLVTAPVGAKGPDDYATMTAEALEANATDMHPAGYYMLAAKRFAAGRRDDAVRWFYIGQLRYRFHLATLDAKASPVDGQAFAALSESVGRPINEYAFGDVDALAKRIDEALAWDAAHDNGFTSVVRYGEALDKQRNGLRGLRNAMLAQKDEIRRQRAQNGLENR